MDEQLSNPSTPNWVWFSRPGTTSSGTFSVLAAVEVLIAVAIYWAYAVWAHTQAHLLVSVFVAPFLLLRSEESTALAIKWFGSYDHWLDRVSDRNLGGFFHIPLMGTLLMGALLMAALPYALLVRIVATATYPIAGMRSISRNWWRTLFATDILSEPEVVPGYRHESIFVYSFVRMVQLKSGAIVPEQKPGRFYRLGLQKWTDRLQHLIFYAFFFGPAYIYRLSIKSSAWAHWPLGYITRPLQYSDDPDEIRTRLWADPREWVRRIFMVLTFAGAIIASLPKLSEIRQTFQSGPVSVVEYVFLIDVRTLLYQPWRTVTLISALITLALTWYGAELSWLVQRGIRRPERQVQAQKWAAALEYAMRLRDVCGWIFWGLVVTHALLWLLPSTDWLGSYPRELLQIIFGDFLPPTLRIGS
jgi:hypothetical protein